MLYFYHQLPFEVTFDLSEMTIYLYCIPHQHYSVVCYRWINWSYINRSGTETQGQRKCQHTALQPEENRTHDLQVCKSLESGQWGRIAFNANKKRSAFIMRASWVLEDLIYGFIHHVIFYFYKWHFYMILPPNMHIFIHFSSRSRNIHPFKLSEAAPSKTVASSHPPSLPLSIPPSLHPRSVYSFDFTPRFIRSIPMSSTPSPFSFTQIHLITSAAVANQRIRECEKKINMAHPGAGGVLEQRFASVRWDERMSWNVKIHCNGLWDE